jgi:hypothetical protein
MRFESVEVPFVTVDNRLCLTDVQIANAPWLADFVRAFPGCFEHSDQLHLYWYYPRGRDDR